MEQVNLQGFINLLPYIIENNITDKHYFGIIDKKCVFDSAIQDYNEEFCKENDILIIHTGDRPAGSIVGFPGDVAFFYMIEKDEEPIEITRVFNILKEKGYNVRMTGDGSHQGSDILVDEKYKVGTYTNSHFGNKIFTAGYFPINIDPNIIRGVCSKISKHTPCNLTCFGISQAELIEIIKK